MSSGPLQKGRKPSQTPEKTSKNTQPHKKPEKTRKKQHPKTAPTPKKPGKTRQNGIAYIGIGFKAATASGRVNIGWRDEQPADNAIGSLLNWEAV